MTYTQCTARGVLSARFIAVQLENKGRLNNGQRAKTFLSALGLSKTTFKCYLSPVLDGVLHAITPHVIMKAVLSSGVLWPQTVLDTGKVTSCTEAEVAWDSKRTMGKMA